MTSAKETAARGAASADKTNPLLALTGLIPLILSLPLYLLGLWTPAVIVGILITLGVIVYHRRIGQGVTSLDLLTLIFGVANAVLYFGFKSDILNEHIAVVIYSILLAQVAASLLHGDPWTLQYAKRSNPRELWDTPAFVAANRFVTVVWGGAFLLCDLAALFGGGALRYYIPIALLVVVAAVTQRLAVWYARTRSLPGVERFKR